MTKMATLPIYGKNPLNILISGTKRPMALDTGPPSTVGKVSGNRCESDCRSRGREFDPGPVPYFRGDWSWNIFYCHSPPFRWIIQEGLLSVTKKVCVRRTGELLVQACPGKSVVRWTDRPAITIAVDLGCKATKQKKNNGLGTWYVAWGCGPYQICTNDESRLTLTYFMGRSNLILNAFIWGKSWNVYFFL